MLRTVLVDDEINGLSALKEKITQHCPAIEIVNTCTNAQTGIEAIDTLKPDLVFLDIEMPVMNGFGLLQQLSYKNFELIFVTAYHHYAIKAIKYSALDYLVKPVDIDDLKLAVKKAESKMNARYHGSQLNLLLENMKQRERTFQRIAIPTHDGLRFLDIKNIIYLEASGNYTVIHTSSCSKFIVSRTLKEFEDMLSPENGFMRIHNSYLININLMERYIRGEGGHVVMCNGITLDVSKRKKAEFMKAIGL